MVRPSTTTQQQIRSEVVNYENQFHSTKRIMIQTRQTLTWLDYDNQILNKQEEQETAHSDGLILKLPFSALNCLNCKIRVDIFGFRRVSTFLNDDEIDIFFSWKSQKKLIGKTEKQDSSYDFSIYNLTTNSEHVTVGMVKLQGHKPLWLVVRKAKPPDF